MNNTLYQRFQNWYWKIRISRSPQANLVWGFFLYTLTGALLLSVPLFHKIKVPLLDHLFIATSAVSTTGLVTVSIGDSYNFFGQLIIMLLIQLGGIGYMTLTTYYLLFTINRITHWHQRIIGAEFAMPKSIRIQDFIRSVVIFTLIMETLGAVAFYLAVNTTEMSGPEAIWFSIFHSVSAFCTAGFGLLNDSFMSFRDDVWVNSIISVLSIAGSLGFIVITDIWYRLSGRSRGLSFTTRIIVYGFLLLLSLGTLLLYLNEPQVQQHSESGLMQAFFQCMTAMTTVGFNTIDTGQLQLPSLLLVLFLMYIGASPSGTAGGMKITTLTAMIAVLKSRLAGQKRITFLNRTIPFERLYVATATFMLYTTMIFFFTFLLSYSEEALSFRSMLFEVASALGTVGLSTGITGDLSAIGKGLIIVLMFVGRVGVLTFGFALLQRKKAEQPSTHRDDLAV